MGEPIPRWPLDKLGPEKEPDTCIGDGAAPGWRAPAENSRRRIDAARKVPAYIRIMDSLIREIEEGRLTSGLYLPASRMFATALGVNRKTVVLAYETLIAQGWLASAGTRGTMVALAPPRRRTAVAHPTPPSLSAPLPGYDVAAPPAASRARPDDRDIWTVGRTIAPAPKHREHRRLFFAKP